MFIIPLPKKTDWRNPPYITISLIVINCLVFFFAHNHDKLEYFEAKKFYFISGLAELEITAYLDYKNERPVEIGKNELKGMDEDKIIEIVSNMEGDGEFIRKLLNDQIITPHHKQYRDWKSLRKKYEQALSEVFFIHYGLIPSKMEPITFLTHMFLHGGYGHLIGNMIFLWLVGCALEIGWGRFTYLLVYIFTGVMAALFHALIQMPSYIPCIGASGAISGILGAYLAAFGKRKIPVFYSILFYFNYTKVPAIVLLPVWIGNEILQNHLGDNEGVAYMAHVGGLLFGSMTAFLVTRFSRQINQQVFEEEPKEKIALLMDKALSYIGKLEIDKARQVLHEILSIQPDYQPALIKLYDIDKLGDNGQLFMQTARRLLLSMMKTGSEPNLTLTFYNDCLSRKQLPAFSIWEWLQLSSYFMKAELLEESGQILVSLAKKNPPPSQAASLCFQMAKKYLKLGDTNKQQQWLKFIIKKFPDSIERQLAEAILQERA